MPQRYPVMNAADLKGRMIGVPSPLVDGPDKVTGRARYTADLPSRDALVARILLSPIAHGRIVSIDTSAAEALPGVAAVVTGADCGVPFGVLPTVKDEFALARDKVRYRGDPVAAVAAVDEATADVALGLIRVEYEELPAYFDEASATAAGAVLIHDDKPGNIVREVHHELGDIAGGLAEAHVVRERSYRFAEVNHAFMEPNAALAEYDALRDSLTLHTTTQVPYYVHLTVARCMGMDPSRVRVVKPFLGGGFGGRGDTFHFDIIACLLARKVGGAVRIQQTREEVFLVHRGRPYTEIRLKLGMTREGKITACVCEALQLGGAYTSYGIVTLLYVGALLHGIYDIPAVKYDGKRVFTNLPAAGGQRGHGTVDVRAAFEAFLDEMAAELGLDPFAVRRANLLPTIPFTTSYGQKVLSYGLPECLDRVEKASGWAERKGSMPKGRGLGMACSHYVSGTTTPVHWTGEPHATVNLKLDFDGIITILTGAADIGQGSTTMIGQVAGEVLGLDWSRFRTITADSLLTPKDNGSFSSRVTFQVGNAAIQAASELKSILVRAAARRLQCQPEQVECLGETYRVRNSGGTGLPFNDVVAEALVDTGTLTTKGTFTSPVEFRGDKAIKGSAIGASMGFCYAAHVVEASVNEVTGKIGVDKIWVAVDVGRALNPLAVEGQIHGAVWMGMGQALCEQTMYKDGRMLHGNFLEYRVPTSMDSPPIEVHIVESIDPNGPFGAKEASEGPLAGCIGALMNAVAQATGARPDELPLSPERVVDLLDTGGRA